MISTDISPPAIPAHLFGYELVIRLLQQQGIDTVFGLSGNGVLGLFDAAAQCGLRMLDTRHESAAVQAAAARAVLLRTPQVCIVTEGPGLANALGGIAGLHHDGIPVIVLSNCEGDELFGTGCFQEAPQVEMTAPISKWSTKVHAIHHLPNVIARAFREAASGIPGPVVITLPNHVLLGQASSTLLQQRQPRYSQQTSAPAPTPDFTDDTLQLLRNARRPLLIAGAGAHWDAAGAGLLALLEHTGIPFGTCSLARGLVPDTHPCCIGNGRPGAGVPGIRDADVVLVLGERMDHLLGFGQLWAPGTAIIQVCADATALGRSVDTVLSTSANSRLVVESLFRAVAGEALWPRSTWLQTLKQQQQQDREALQSLAADTRGIHPLQVGQALAQAADALPIRIFDGANSMLWVRDYLATAPAQHSLELGRLGMIGFGLPWALGAQSAAPARPVLLITGDGSLGFHFMEFETALRHQLPVVIVVCNDAAWGIEQHFQQRIFGRTTGTALQPVRYDLLAIALGGFGAAVEYIEQLPEALNAALAAGKPAIINVTIANPPHPTVSQFAQRLHRSHTVPV